MKGIKFFLALIVISFFSFVSADYSNTTTTSSSEGYNTPIIDGSIKFEAKEDNGYVYTKWNSYTGDEKFKFYKVVRSTKISNPVYPDNGYIKYSGDVNYNEFKDTKPEVGINYYRVCAMTYDNNRYCSNVEKIEIKKESNPTICTMEYAPVCGYKDGKYKTYSNKCVLNSIGAKYKNYGECKTEEIKPVDYTREYVPVCGYKDDKYKTYGNKCTLKSAGATYKYMGKCTNNENINTGLDYKIRLKSDQLVKKFIYSIDKKEISSNQKIEVINNIITKLVRLKESKEKLTDIIDYLISKLKEELVKYENDFSDIESIFGEY